MLGKIQMYAIAAGAFLLAIVVAAGKLINYGAVTQRNKDADLARREKDAFESAITSGHIAGNDADAGRLQPVESDPNNRANRKKR